MRLAVFSALLLAGCASTQPGIQVKTVEVVREVQMPCPVEKPARPDAIGTLPKGAADALRIVAAKLREYVAPGGYVERAEAAIETCRTPVTNSP